jgi:hypothetical protein
MATGPEIRVDRMPVNRLWQENPETLTLLEERGIGKTGDRKTVHFCGLADAGTEGAVFFLPRHAQGSPGEMLKTAGLTMRVLARYGREVESRKGIVGSPGDNAALAALIYDLARDFRDNGIYSERERYGARNSGKADWKRTISRETPFLTSSGTPVYPDTRTTRSLASHETLLAQIQAAVLSEIVEKHSWWLSGIASRAGELRSFRPPPLPRFLWPGKLRLLLPLLYARRPVFLANAMISYLEKTAGNAGGKFVCGVEDFSSVWEHMLRKVLPGVEEGWNARLPKPGYVRADSGNVEMQQGMKTDIVVRDGTHLTVVDAKYYGATGKGRVPGWPDIVKQLFYEMALKTVVSNDETVSNCFAFPSGGGSIQAYERVHIYNPDQTNTDTGAFPEIDCRYFDILHVMGKYLNGGFVGGIKSGNINGATSGNPQAPPPQIPGPG